MTEPSDALECIKYLRAKMAAAEATAERFRDTNRRMNRRLQLLEGWWQRRLERAKSERGIYWDMFLRDNKAKVPNLGAIEEAAYQRGYADGHDERFSIPTLRRVKARPAALTTGATE